MRWDDLFRDLEGQLEAAQQGDLEAEVADRTRREAALVRLVDRLRGSSGARLRLQVDGLGAVEGTVSSVGSEWLLIDGGDRHTMVLIPAVLSVIGLGGGSTAEPEGPLFARLRLGSALRGIARDRRPVTAFLRDGSAVRVRLERVGADYVDVSDPDEAGELRAVPFSALAALRMD
jgi:hypothetical protein